MIIYLICTSAQAVSQCNHTPQPHQELVLFVAIQTTLQPIALESLHLLQLLHHPLYLTIPLPARRPFVPPSYHNQLVSVSSSTTGDSAATPVANSVTHVDPARGNTQKQPAHTRTQTLNNNFHALPVGIETPINIQFLETCLQSHPDRELVHYLVNGFRHGFDIGFRGPMTLGRSHNLLSARSNSLAVMTAINKELSRGHTSGPFASPPMNLHFSPLGAVRKKDGTHRIILDLSSPRGSAINEGIPRDEFSVTYSLFDEAVDLVNSLGPIVYMGKLDIKHAFRLCPVRLEDWALLGFSWDNMTFLDTRLPFGSRSSPFIFNQFATALLWILVSVYGINNITHYLDDFFLCAELPQNNVVQTCSACNQLFQTWVYH